MQGKGSYVFQNERPITKASANNASHDVHLGFGTGIQPTLPLATCRPSLQLRLGQPWDLV